MSDSVKRVNVSRIAFVQAFAAACAAAETDESITDVMQAVADKLNLKRNSVVQKAAGLKKAGVKLPQPKRANRVTSVAELNKLLGVDEAAATPENQSTEAQA